MNGIVHIEMDPEHGILLTRFQLTVKPEVILVGKISRFSGPERFGGVHHLLLIRVDILAVLPFLLLSADDGNGEETAVLAGEECRLASARETPLLSSSM